MAVPRGKTGNPQGKHFPKEITTSILMPLGSPIGRSNARRVPVGVPKGLKPPRGVYAIMQISHRGLPNDDSDPHRHTHRRVSQGPEGSNDSRRAYSQGPEGGRCTPKGAQETPKGLCCSIYSVRRRPPPECGTPLR